MGPAHSRLVAVVTGASSGMGLATAEALAARGYDLVLSSRNPAGAAERIANGSGVTVRAVPGSIADPETAAAIAAAAESMGGASALLINHGGPPVRPLMELTDDDWRSAFAMMVTGPLGVLRAIVPQMQARGQGRILAVSSFTAKSPWGGHRAVEQPAGSAGERA